MLPIKNRLYLFIIYLILFAFAIYSVLPFLWTALQSIKTVLQAESLTPLFIFKPTFQNYIDLWLKSVPKNPLQFSLVFLGTILGLILLVILLQRLPISRAVSWFVLLGGIILILYAIPRVLDTAQFYEYFLNTVIVATGTVIVSIGIGCLSGYALARFKGIDGLVLLIAALSFYSLPSLAYALPYFTLGQITGLHDTYFLLIVVMVALDQPFTIWMLRSFFADIPIEIEEAALVDGANRLTAFWKVVIPIMWPGIISTALFTVIGVYHSFLIVLVLAQLNWTMSVAVSQYAGSEYTRFSTMPFAASISASLLIMVVVIFFQKQLVKGLTAGAIK
jgi:multiple sugar transport system permease protein